jgi:hypothetical protein
MIARSLLAAWPDLYSDTGSRARLFAVFAAGRPMVLILYITEGYTE